MSRLPIAAIVALLASGLALAVAVLPAQSQASPIHVDIAAAGANNGTTWADAYTDLQDALATATAGDDILIAEGTYRPHTTDRSVSFAMKDGVDLHGGHPTGGGTPNPDRHRTILSGDLNADDYSSDLLGLSTDNAADNSLHVVTADGSVVSGTTIEGVTITGGRANGPVVPNGATGGGVLSDGATLVITDSVIRGNLAGVPGVDLATPGVDGRGAGVAAIGGSLTIRDSLIADNWLREGVQGGGLTAVDATAAVTSSVVRGNSPSGVHNIDGTLTITASVVSETLGYGVVNQGGAATIVGSAVERNHGAVNSAGFIDSPGGGVFDDGGQSMTIVGSTIRNNFTPANGGGVVFSSTSSATIDTSLITGNRAGAATIGGTGGDGGGVFDASLASTITGSVIVGNTATNSGGIYGGGVGTSMSNSIVYGNGSPGITLASGGTATVNHSLVEGWVGGGVGNIDADPLFVAPGNYRLLPGSPAREAGDNTAVPADVFDVDGDGDTAEPTPDLDGRARINGTVDMGAYETPVPGDTFPGLTITGPTGTATGSTEGATGQPGEPDTACDAKPILPLESIWFSWTAPNDDEIAFDTFGSDFDTHLHLYQGTELGSLTEIDCSDDEPGHGNKSRVIFTPTTGTTYRIRVDGWGQTDGTVTLNWGQPPIFVNTAGFVVLEGDTGTTSADYTLTLSRPAAVPVSIQIGTPPVPPNPGIAQPFDDFAPVNQIVTFTPGDTEETVTFDIIGDTLDEPPALYGEWGFVQFTPPTGDAELNRTNLLLGQLGIFIIIDDDP